MRRLVVILTLLGLLGAFIAVPAGPAAGQTAGALVGGCEITLTWPVSAPNTAGETCDAGTGMGQFDLPSDGKAFGVFTVGTTPHPCPASGCTFGASVSEYSEQCVGGEPPLIGDAKGTATVSDATASASADFRWARVGLVAVIVFDDGDGSPGDIPPTGAGVAAFVPEVPAPDCGDVDVGQLTAHVVGFAGFTSG